MRIEFGELRGVGQILVHLVAAFRGAQMREARAGHEHMRRILVVDRREHALLLERAGEIDRLAQAAVGDQLAQGNAGFERLFGEVDRRARALDEPAYAARRDHESTLSVLVDNLRQPHLCSSFSMDACMRASINA